MAWRTSGGPIQGNRSLHDRVEIRTRLAGSGRLSSLPDTVSLGSPSITTFSVGQEVHTGSGIYLAYYHTYSWSQDFTGPSRTVHWGNTFADVGDGFVMLWGLGVETLQTSDVGRWTYTETWTDNINSSTITFVQDFEVRPLPIPGAVWLLGSGLVGLVGLRRKFTK